MNGRSNPTASAAATTRRVGPKLATVPVATPRRAAPKFAAASLIVALLLAAIPSSSLAISEQVPIGARGIAMGGAFSSIADDATAMFWNPAGLARIGHQEIMGTHANLFNTGINDDVLAFALPLTLNQAAAVDWYHSGFDD